MSRDSYNRADIDDLFRRMQTFVVRGTISSVDDGPKMQEVGLDLEDGMRATKVEQWHHYGLSYHPKKDSEVLAVSLGGNRDHMVVIATADRRYRLKDLAEGEIAIHDDQGQKVHFTRDGIVADTPKKVTIKSAQEMLIESAAPLSIKAPAGMSIDTPTLTLKGDLSQEGSITSTGAHVAGGGHV